MPKHRIIMHLPAVELNCAASVNALIHLRLSNVVLTHSIIVSSLVALLLTARNFRGRKLSRISRICAVPRKFSLRIYGAWHTTRGRNFWRMRTQGAIFPSIDWHVLAQVCFQTNSSPPKSDGPALSTVVPSSSIVGVNRQAWGEDTWTPTGSKRTRNKEKAQIGNGPRSTVWQRQFTTSLSLTRIDRWMKLLWYVSNV